MFHRQTRRHRLPLAAAGLAAALAFVLVPAAGRFVPSSPEPLRGGLAAAAPGSMARVDEAALGGAATAVAGLAIVAPSPGSLLARTGEPRRAPDPATLSGYRWPLVRGRLTLPFGPYAWGSFRAGRTNVHDGVDIASFCGAPVVAAHAGVVLAAGRHFDDWLGWLGSLDAYYRRLDRKHRWPTLPNAVVTDDGNGYRSVYAHFERVVVRPGQRVRAGQLIGYEGRTGHASGCHVHYGLFSPYETARFSIRPDVGKRLRTPPFEIARIDPFLVLPDAALVLRTGHLHDPLGTSTAAAAR